MSRSNFRVEQGIEILDANGVGGIWLLMGSGAPTGTSGPTDDAPIGSMYLSKDSAGVVYHKKTSDSSADDWKRLVDESIYTSLGIAFGDEDLGTFTGGVVTDDSTLKPIIQELSDAIEAISGGQNGTTAIDAATPTVVGEFLVDSKNLIEWECFCYDTATMANIEAFKVTAIHNGTPSADADAFDESVHTKLSTNKIAGLSFTTKLTGTGAAQTIGLEISATAAITVVLRRTALDI